MLHYRIFDVSALKEAARRWCGEDVLEGVPKKGLSHRAVDDIYESIEEARYYMDVIFKPARSLEAGRE
jgi:oligoribonuclease